MPQIGKTKDNKKMETIGVGIIGAGGIAQKIHIPGYQELEDVEVRAVADPVEASRISAAEQYHIPHTYADYTEMLKRDDIDVISVTTPNFLHAEAAIAALNAGKDVLCEKPLAMNATEGAAMVAAARKNGRKLMCGYNQRFRPEAKVLRDYVKSGAMGNIYYARAQAMRRRGIPGWGLFISKEKNGGGALIDIGVHILDLTLHIAGYPKPVAVSGKTWAKFGKRKDVVGLMGQWDYENFTVEDFAVAQIRFENDFVLTLESSFCANIEENSIFNFSLLGDKGGCQLAPLKMFTEKDKTLLDITPVFLPSGIKSHYAEIASFIDSVRHDKPVFTPGEEALQVTRIIDAIYESSETGKEVVLGDKSTFTAI